MTQIPDATGQLYSTLGADPDLEDIVEMFVDEMPERVSNLLGFLHGSDWEGLRRAAHQLKGAAGSYGFHPITPSASRLEAAIRQDEPEEEIHRAVEALVDLCNRVQAGSPEQ